jgi:hypothetical protein
LTDCHGTDEQGEWFSKSIELYESTGDSIIRLNAYYLIIINSLLSAFVEIRDNENTVILNILLPRHALLKIKVLDF